MRHYFVALDRECSADCRVRLRAPIVARLVLTHRSRTFARHVVRNAGWRLLFLDFRGDSDIDCTFDAHRGGTFRLMCVEGALRSIAGTGGDLEVIVDADSSDSNHAVDVFDVTFNLAPNLVWMAWDFTNCQGP